MKEEVGEYVNEGDTVYSRALYSVVRTHCKSPSRFLSSKDDFYHIHRAATKYANRTEECIRAASEETLKMEERFETIWLKRIR